MSTNKRPYWLWDYDLTEQDVRRILHGKNETERRWLIGRILTSVSFPDIWDYLSLKDIVRIWPKLHLRPDIKRNWQGALREWGYAGQI